MKKLPIQAWKKLEQLVKNPPKPHSRLKNAFKSHKTNTTPYFSIGNEELAEKKQVGTHAICPRCGEKHKIEYSRKTKKVLIDGSLIEAEVDGTLGFISCGENQYLVAIAGKEL